MNKLKPKAVIFDLGSTLIEYETIPWPELSRHCAASVREFLVGRGHNVPAKEPFITAFEEAKEEYRQIANETLKEWTVPEVAEKFLAVLGIDMEDGLVDDVFKAYYKPVGEQLSVYDDTLDVIKKIKCSVPVIGLVSNTVFPDDAHRKELKRFGIETLLNFTVFSSSFGLRKPHQDIFYKAANLAGFAPSECVYIGDRYVEDYLGPSKIGMPAILKILPKREYPADMPDDIRKIACLSDLEKHLDI